MPAELQLIGSEGASEPILFGNDPDNPGGTTDNTAAFTDSALSLNCCQC